MNYQQYGYKSFTGQDAAEYFNEQSDKKYQLAYDRGWRTARDAFDEAHGHTGGYHRRAHYLPNHVQSWNTVGNEIGVKSNSKKFFFHHPVMRMVHNSPFNGNGIRSINILEMECNFKLWLLNTCTVLEDVNFYFLIMPDPYFDEISKQHDEPDNKEEAFEMQSEVQIRANTRIRAMIQEYSISDPHILDPVQNGSVSGYHRYQIDKKHFRQIKNGQDGLFYVNFKFNSSPKSGDINLKYGEGLFIVVTGVPNCPFDDFNVQMSSDLNFRYTVN